MRGGIASRLITIAFTMLAVSFLISVVAQDARQGWLSMISQLLALAAFPDLAVGAWFALRDGRELREAGLHKFRADVIRSLEVQRAVKRADREAELRLLTEWTSMPRGEDRECLQCVLKESRELECRR